MSDQGYGFNVFIILENIILDIDPMYTSKLKTTNKPRGIWSVTPFTVYLRNQLQKRRNVFDITSWCAYPPVDC